MRREILFLLILAGLYGCSNEQIYQSVQANRLSSCEKLFEAQRDKCIDQHDTPYQEYQRAREEVIRPSLEQGRE